MIIWDCKIGGPDMPLPPGADHPMRRAVAKAYFDLVGEWPTFIFSGWGGSLTDPEREVLGLS
jgi:hypothetical protein